jgi:hypothetical protein
MKRLIWLPGVLTKMAQTKIASIACLQNLYCICFDFLLFLIGLFLSVGIPRHRLSMEITCFGYWSNFISLLCLQAIMNALHRPKLPPMPLWISRTCYRHYHTRECLADSLSFAIISQKISFISPHDLRTGQNEFIASFRFGASDMLDFASIPRYTSKFHSLHASQLSHVHLISCY